MRIIAGELRGRRLASPAPGVRPTSDRIRESLFSRLGELRGARVLDLFAGSGALGIEAISRGAEAATFIDRSSRVISVLQKTLAALSIADRSDAIKMNARGAVRRLAEAGARFDLILLDPPYDDFEALAPLLTSIIDGDLLAEGGVVVVESAKRHAVAPVLDAIPGLRVESTRTYGDTAIAWLTSDDDEAHSGGTDRR